MALLVRSSGQSEKVSIEQGNSLKQLQAFVGGSIEYVPVLNENVKQQGYAYCYCNEEGKLQGLPANPVASVMAGRIHFDPLAGDVVFMREGDEQE